MDQYYFLMMALAAGFLSAPHCLAMCGGIAGALALTAPANEVARSRWLRLAYHNVGRITSYLLLGMLTGWLGHSLVELAPPMILMFRVLAGVLMVAMGLYIAGWWMGLKVLENAGYGLWQLFINRFPAVTLSSGRGFRSGILWGFLPCGLVYTMLAMAMATGSAISGGLLMLCFGIGTLPTLVTAGFFAERAMSLANLQSIRSAMGVVVIMFGLWTLTSAVWMQIMM